jgi:hypothetical protein
MQSFRILVVTVLLGASACSTPAKETTSERHPSSIREDSIFFLKALKQTDHNVTAWKSEADPLTGSLLALANTIQYSIDWFVATHNNPKTISMKVYKINFSMDQNKQICFVGVGDSPAFPSNERFVEIVGCNESFFSQKNTIFRGLVTVQ